MKTIAFALHITSFFMDIFNQVINLKLESSFNFGKRIPLNSFYLYSIMPRQEI